MYRHLLVPSDGTDISIENIGRAVEFARETGARITFFFATPDYSTSADGALMHAVSPSLFAEKAAGHARAILSKAEAAARAAGVSCQSVTCVSDRPANAILETVTRENCDLIFMASRGPRSIGGVMLGSETLKVLAHSTVPVLVSSIARNTSTPERNAAIAIIQDEHRSLAAVLHALRFLVDEARDKAATPNLRLLRAMLHYLRAFPETLHHPKEDAYLFQRLRTRTPAFNAVIDELQGQHRDGAAVLEGLDKAVDDYEARGATALGALSDTLERFTKAQWQHMDLEEKVVLPAAQRHLAPDDWVEIADAFGKNGDPRFGAEVDAGFQNLFSKIMNLAPPKREHDSRTTRCLD